MDANIIYEKTAAGEEAVRQRTRVVQRKTRMVLILVDGRSTLGDLCEKTGNVELVETALRDLERDGFIVAKLAQDPIQAPTGNLAEDGQGAVAPVPAFELTPSTEPPFASLAHPGQQGVGRLGWPRKLFSRRRLAGEDASIGPLRRGVRAPYVSLPLLVALGVVGVMLLATLTFLFYPYDSHRPQLEAALSRIAGQSISIAGVHAGLLPRPAIFLEEVKGENGGGLQAARIRLVPEVFSLLGPQPVFSLVEVESARLQAKALAVLPTAIADVMAPTAPAVVRALGFKQLEAEVSGLTIKDLQAEIHLGEAVHTATFLSADRSLRIVLKSQPQGFVAEFEGYGWRPQAEARFRFDSLQGLAVWDGHSLAIRSLDARIFDGAILGELRLDSLERPTLAGDITVKHMNLRRLAAALGYGSQFEGELVGTLRFSGSAPEWQDVFAGVTGEGDFVVKHGVLGSFDLVEAVRRGPGEVRGGATRYEQLSGRLRVSPGAIRFADLALVAGLLRCGGHLEVAHDGRLDGRLDVELRGSASRIRMPLIASGMLKDPVLQGRRR